MEALVDQGMREGAIGLSSGLEYEVGSYASTEEVVALARVAARHGGFYISHIRDEADKTLEAVREAIAIGEQARLPVQITHIKLGTVGVWGKAQEVVALIEAARKRGVDVTADAYPYLAWSSNLKVLVPNKQCTDPASVKEALDDVGGGRNIQFTRLADVSAVRRQAPGRDRESRRHQRSRRLHPHRRRRRRFGDRAHDDASRTCARSTSNPG